MCGRFTLASPDESLAELLDLDAPPALKPRYNIAPTQPVAVLRPPPEGAPRAIELLRWGLVPSWSKDETIGNRMINARSETVADKPAFRSAFRRRRCLVLADGFYEWQRREGGKQPYHIRLADGGPFAFAGLWEHWQSPDGSDLETCTILTTTPNSLLAEVHNRMPVIVDRDDYALWLDSQVEDAKRLHPLLQPYPADRMVAVPVTRHVNSPRNDDRACLEPMPDTT